MDKLVWTPYPDPNSPVLFDVRGHRRAGSLFIETSQDKNRDPIFTLKDYNSRGMISAYNLYMDSVDEYDAACKIVGSMTHWRKLMASPWFMQGNPELNFTGLATWRKDMQARDLSRAKRVLQEKVAEGDRAAAKMLLDTSVKGETAGLQESKPTLRGVANRRGVQGPADVIDLDERFSNLQGD